MGNNGYGYTNRIGDIDAFTDEPELAKTQDLILAMNDAYVVYNYGNKSYEWYLSICRTCNAELVRRGEKEEPVHNP